MPADAPETAKNKGTRAHQASQDKSRFGNAPVSIRPLDRAAANRTFSFLNIRNGIWLCGTLIKGSEPAAFFNLI